MRRRQRLLVTSATIVVGALYFGTTTAGDAASQCGTDPSCVYVGGVSYFDPTSFHVTSSVATGSDPVLLNNSTAFSIQDNGGQNISQPLTIFIAGPIGSVAPTIASTSYTSPNPGSTTTPLTGALARSLIGNDTARADLYTFVGCVACDNSLNFTNIDAAYAADGLAKPTGGLTVWSFTVPKDFVGKDQVNVVGSFADGDIVFPFAENGAGTDKVTIFDTSWTNTGFVDCAPGKCGVSPPPPPPPPPVPEPSSLLLLGFGLVGLGAAARRQMR